LVFYSSTITMMHGPISIKYTTSLSPLSVVLLGKFCCEQPGVQLNIEKEKVFL